MSAILDVIVKAYHLIQFFLFKLWVIIEIFKFGYLNVYLSEEYQNYIDDESIEYIYLWGFESL